MRRPRVQLLAASLAVTLSVTFMGIGVTLSAPNRTAPHPVPAHVVGNPAAPVPFQSRP